MIGGIAGHELIQQRRRHIRGQARDEAGARANEVGIDVVEAGGSNAPERIGHYGLPGVVDVPEGQAIVVVDVVVDADQLFAPSGGKRDGLGERREAGIGGVWNRDEGLERLTNRANRHCCGIGNVRTVRAGTQIRKITAAFGDRRDVLQDRIGVLLSPPFLRKEEESLFLVGVVVVRDVHRTADGVAEVVFLVRRVRIAGFAARFPWFGVEKIVAQVFEGTAVEGAAA